MLSTVWSGLYCVGVGATSICFPCYGYRIIVLSGHPANHSELQYWSDLTLHCPHVHTEENNKSQGEEEQHLHQDIWRHFNVFPAHSSIASLLHSAHYSTPADQSVAVLMCPDRRPNEVWLVLRARPDQECREVVWLHSLTCQAQGPPATSQHYNTQSGQNRRHI